ncbi:MAG: ABC transporter permease subunit [Gammaproteobacteria bacterium]|nr:ABC transporter permease subunit [Gammaproteobacteria bacterium]MCW8927605.1 ABC transporter permease subunit [Gammaproteobacteria bacterium]MCW8958369.1 ABC transporter permease subunit [Gammaproteobacteria bacterium]MCW8972623.1 ABC transporter permease subunit [Gammaproteobacteria bacterium]MCW8992535.1 ABC transporter permease subunit [Gammaproteobacteria bacterium]
MISHIAARELRSLFLSPLAWTILAVVQFILAWMFLGQLDTYIAYQSQIAMMENPPGATEVIVAPLFSSATLILLLVIPLLTMRLVSEERRAGTLPLLLSAPVSMGEIVLGKYLGLLGFLAIMLGLVTLMPLSLLSLGTLDFGLLASNLIGVALMVAAFAAAGLFMSTLTAQPVVAAISTFGLLLLLWIIEWTGQSISGNTTVISYLSLQSHYEALLRGLFDSSDIVYYLLFITTFLVLSIRRLDAERL